MREAGTHMISPASSWSSSGVSPQAGVQGACSGYQGVPASVMSAPSAPLCIIAALALCAAVVLAGMLHPASIAALDGTAARDGGQSADSSD